jgi:signal transduction histidine kinase
VGDPPSSEGLRETIARLSDLYTGSDARAVMDREAFLKASDGVFESLGWSIALFAVHDDQVELEHTLGVFPDEACAQFFGSLEGRTVPLALFPDMAACVRTRRGTFKDGSPAHAAEITRGMGWAEEESRKLADAMARLDRDRRALVPVVAGDRARHVVMGTGPSLQEGDFAALQLFAAQLAASEVFREMTEDMARQQRLAGLGQLSMMVAHEVRNPLAVIFQACRQIRRHVEVGGPEEPLLDILDEEAGRLKRLVDDLVEFAGPTKPRLQTVDLSEVVRWCLMGLQDGEETPVGRSHFTAHIADEASLVHADPLLLRQALTHLLSHAFERVGPEGSVRLEAERRGDAVQVRVCDDGPPMTPEVARKVFEPFFTTSPGGSGLGLAVVRRLIEDQQGRVDVDLEAVDGCVFFIDIAAAQPEGEPVL